LERKLKSGEGGILSKNAVIQVARIAAKAD